MNSGTVAGVYPQTEAAVGGTIRYFADFAKRGRWLGERRVVSVELTEHVADYAGAVAEAKRLEGVWCHSGWALWSVRLVREAVK
jgi:hypothetical protein